MARRVTFQAGHASRLEGQGRRVRLRVEQKAGQMPEEREVPHQRQVRGPGPEGVGHRLDQIVWAESGARFRLPVRQDGVGEQRGGCSARVFPLWLQISRLRADRSGRLFRSIG